MLEDLGGVGGLTAGGVLLLAVLLVLRGQIVSRRTVEDIRSVYEARVTDARAEAAVWQEAWKTSQETVQLQAKQIGEFAETTRTVEKVFHVLRDAKGAS